MEIYPELVVTAPFLLFSTPDGQHRWFYVYIMYFFCHQQRLDYLGCSELHCTPLLEVWQGNKPGFAAIFMGYLWYGVFAQFLLLLSFFHMFYVCHNLVCFFQLNEIKIDRYNSLFTMLCLGKPFSFYVFYCLRRIHDLCMPSSAPHQSQTYHLTQFQVPKHLPTSPHRTPCILT